jgi:hypothetical protein
LPLLSPATLDRLLTAIENDTLVFLCGAGLSMAWPSKLPSALAVANECYDRRIPIEDLPAHLRDDVDQLAGYFHARGSFERIFIRLVPWNELLGESNDGHAAIGDLLVVGAARAALSANFDPLIESWAQRRKVDMLGALTGQDAQNAREHMPLVKFHGCMRIDRLHTLWTHPQLGDAAMAARIDSVSQWMQLLLPEKDLVVVGFWSDWGYLNDVLTNAFTATNANSVTVIDPSPAAALLHKAPILWQRLNAASPTFEHVPHSGADVLKELRAAFSKAWARRFFALSQVPAGAGPSDHACLATMDVDDLYRLRQDAEGVPYPRAATKREPEANSSQAAFARALFLNAGAAHSGAWLSVGPIAGPTTIRVINGAGQDIAGVRTQYSEPPAVSQPDIIVCAGAVEYGVPPKIIPTGSGASTVRPAAGGPARWLTLEEARKAFLI